MRLLIDVNGGVDIEKKKKDAAFYPQLVRNVGTHFSYSSCGTLL